MNPPDYNFEEEECWDPDGIPNYNQCGDSD